MQRQFWIPICNAGTTARSCRLSLPAGLGESFLQNKQWGLMDAFKHHDIAEIKAKDFLEYLDRISQKRPDLSSSTRNMLTATFRNVMKGAVLDGVIDAVPATPRSRQKDNPRAYFPFYPLVSREDCVWTKVRHGAQACPPSAPMAQI